MVIGWTIKPINPAENNGHGLLWEVEFERDRRNDDEQSRVAAMKHPLAEETDDYVEYKRVRKELLRTVRNELVSGISTDDIPPTPPSPGGPENPTVTVQSPPMSPRTEQQMFDYGILPEPELPASGLEGPPPLRTPFFHLPPSSRSPYIQPSPSPRSQAGPFARPDHERPASPRQSRGLTVPQSVRQSISAINPDARASKNNKNTLLLPPPPPSREYRGSITRSISRIFSDGAADSPNVPESPFGSTYITNTNYDGNNISPKDEPSYPFDTPSPLRHPRQHSTLAEPKPHPILRQPQWGILTTTTTNNSSNRDAADPATDNADSSWPLHLTHVVRRRRARAVYEAFAHQNQDCPPDARLVLAALNAVWHDAAEPEYPDMVLEESAYERAGRQGYSFGGGLEKRGSYVGLTSSSASVGGFGSNYYNSSGYYSVNAAAVGGRTGSWSSVATSRVSPRGSRVGDELVRRRLSLSAAADVGMQVLLLQQQLQQPPRLQLQEGGGGGRAGRGHWVKRSWSSGDADAAAAAAASRGGDHPSAGSSPDSAVALRWLNGGSGGGDGGKVAARRRRSASVVESRRSAGDGNRSRRPTIVRFSGMFKRQNLDDTVDEGVDEASAEEEERRWRKKKGGGQVKAAEVLGQDFVVGADW